jgi:hypothetical protein
VPRFVPRDICGRRHERFASAARIAPVPNEGGWARAPVAFTIRPLRVATNWLSHPRGDPDLSEQGPKPPQHSLRGPRGGACDVLDGDGHAVERPERLARAPPRAGVCRLGDHVRLVHRKEGVDLARGCASRGGSAAGGAASRAQLDRTVWHRTELRAHADRQDAHPPLPRFVALADVT